MSSHFATVPALPEGPNASDLSFDSDWLDLREAADAAAREAGDISRSLPRQAQWRCLDLGAGTGANLRHLMPRLGGQQYWWLIDADPRLLAAAADRLAAWAAGQGLACRIDDVLQGAGSSGTGADVAAAPARRRRWTRIDIDGPDWQATIAPRRLDLSRRDWLEQLAGPRDARRADPAAVPADKGARPGAGAPPDEAVAAPAAINLVTASALLDLVSSTWLNSLVDWCAARRIAMLFALSFDGELQWAPALDDDARISAALARDQRRDKGLGPGPALGAAAVGRLRARLEARGYQHAQARSDWQLGLAAEGQALQERLIADWAALVRDEVGDGGGGAAMAAAWAEARRRELAAGQSTLRVGHLDLAAWPLA